MALYKQNTLWTLHYGHTDPLLEEGQSIVVKTVDCSY